MKNLDFTGGGKIKVSVDDIVKSERWQENVRAVRRIANQEFPMTEPSKLPERADFYRDGNGNTCWDRDQAEFVDLEEYERLFRSISEVPAMRWIPVEERMPKPEQAVLGYWPKSYYYSGGSETVKFYPADAPDSSDAWIDGHGEGSDPPTHWMPSPEAPK